jgi:hypothetical protein
MLRNLTPLGNRPIKATFKASEAMKQGMAVSLDIPNSEVDKATGVGDYIVDVPKKYEGIYAVVNPEDDAFEDIDQGDRVLVIPTYVGDRFATDQITITGLSAGDPLDVANGLFIEATSNDAYQWIYVGTYSDPTGTLHVIERVPKGTVA